MMLTKSIAVFLVFVYGFGQCKVKLSDPMPKEFASDNYNPNNSAIVPLRIYSSLPYGGLMAYGSMVTETARIILTKLKESPNFLPGYEIVFEPFDDRVSTRHSKFKIHIVFSYFFKINPQLAVNNFFREMGRNHQVSSRIPVFFQSVSGEATKLTSPTLPFYNFVGMSIAMTEPVLYRNPHRFRNLLVVLPDVKYLYEKVLPMFLNAMGWKKFAIIGQNFEFWNDWETSLIKTMLETDGTELIGLFKYLYISGEPPVSEYIEVAVKQLKESNARVIILNSVAASRIACWMHRYGIYGPNYVIFVHNVLVFTENDMFRFHAWCTPKMLAEVLESVFFIGVGNEMSLDMKDTLDMNGITSRDFNAALSQRIEETHAIPMYWGLGIGSQFYDTFSLLCHMLNRTEAKLREQNDTLSNWFTNGKKFQERGKEFAELFKSQSYYQYKGVTGVIKYKPEDGLTEVERFNYGIYQAQKDGKGSFKHVPVATATYDREKRSKLIIRKEKMKWRTKDGKPPTDSLDITIERKPLIKPATTSALTTIAGILIGSQICVISVAYWLQLTKLKMSNYKIGHFTILTALGNSLLLIFVLVLPSENERNFGNRWSSSLGCLIVGVITLTSTLVSRLRFFTKSNHVANYKRKFNQTLKQPKCDMYLAFDLFITLVAIALVLVAFIREPVECYEELGRMVISENDDSLAFRSLETVCQVRFSKLSTIICLSILALLFIGCILHGFLASIQHEAESKRGNNPVKKPGVTTNKIGQLGMQFRYCFIGSTVLMICALIISCAIFVVTSEQGAISLSVAVFLITIFCLIATASDMKELAPGTFETTNSVGFLMATNPGTCNNINAQTRANSNT